MVTAPDMKMLDDLVSGLAEDTPTPPPVEAVIDKRLSAPEGMELLLNLKYKNETIYVPENGKFLGQRTLRFIDGWLACSKEDADFVRKSRPYIFTEPQGLTTKPFQHDQTKWQTRIPEAFQVYVQQQAENS